MNILSISDIFIQICENIQNIKQLLNLELISLNHMCVIRKGRFINLQIYIPNDTIMKYIVNNYNFANLDLNKCIQYFDTKYLKKLSYVTSFLY